MKRAIIKEVIHTFIIDLLLLQETKLSSMSDSTIKELWGSSQCSWVCLDASGSSGGILLCWNSRFFAMKDNFSGAFSASAVLKDKVTGLSWILSSVNGATDRRLHGNF